MTPWLASLLLVVTLMALALVLEWRVPDKAQKMTTIMVLGLLSAVLVFQVDTRHAVDEANGRMTSALQRSEESVRRAMPFAEAFADDVQFGATLRAFADAHRQLKERPETLLLSMFRDRLETLGQDWLPLKNGRIALGGDELRLLSVLAVRNARSSVDATNFVDYSSWWETELGRKYQLANIEAVDKGKRVRRVFVFRTVEECYAASAQIGEQAARGIVVYVALEDRVPAASMFDVLIVDHELVGKLDLDRDRKSLGAKLYTDELNIAEVQSIFEDIMSVSVLWSRSSCQGLVPVEVPGIRASR